MAAQQTQGSGPVDAPALTEMTVAVVLYENFELIDAMGPWQLFSRVNAADPNFKITVYTVAEKKGLVQTGNENLKIHADYSFDDVPDTLDAILVPGCGSEGWTIMGVTPTEDGGWQQDPSSSSNPALVNWLRKMSGQLDDKPAHPPTWITSVCTGSPLLCYAGVLRPAEGHTIAATANKSVLFMDPGFIRTLELYDGSENTVDWQDCGRWVVAPPETTGLAYTVATSSGITAGMDLAAFLIGAWFGDATRDATTTWNEYEWHSDPKDDPFGRCP